MVLEINNLQKLGEMDEDFQELVDNAAIYRTMGNIMSNHQPAERNKITSNHLRPSMIPFQLKDQNLC